MRCPCLKRKERGIRKRNSSGNLHGVKQATSSARLAALGHLSKPKHPEVQTAIDSALACIRASGKAAGIFSADYAVAMDYRQRDACFLLADTDTLLLRNTAVQLAEAFKDG